MAEAESTPAQTGKIESLKSKFWSKIKMVFEKSKKKSLSEAIKQFDGSKESISKEVEDSKGELQPKVVEIYESSEDKTKVLLKDPSASTVEAEPALVQSLLQELKSAGFPGASALSDAIAKFGTAALAGPITFLLAKASSLVQDEPSPAIPAAEKEIETKVEAETVEATETNEEATASEPAPIAEAETSVADESTKEPQYTEKAAVEVAEKLIVKEESTATQPQT